jgi:hypothetical protein
MHNLFAPRRKDQFMALHRQRDAQRAQSDSACSKDDDLHSFKSRQ